MHVSKWWVGVVCLFAAQSASAGGPPPNVLTNMAIKSPRDGELSGHPTDDYKGSYPFKLEIAGNGTCGLRVEIHSAEFGILYRRWLYTPLPFNWDADFAVPNVGNNADHHEYTLHVFPEKDAAGNLCPVFPFGVSLAKTFKVITQGAKQPVPSASLNPKPADFGTPPKNEAALQRQAQSQSQQGGGVDWGPAASGTMSSVAAGTMEGTDENIKVAGTGTCAFELRVAKDGGGFDKTWNIKTLTLPRTLVNGLDFDTLPPGNYTATLTGKNGCKGTAKSSFVVTALVQNVTYPQQLTWKKPNEAQAFKGGDLWFGLTMPDALKSVPSIGCCEFEFQYRDGSGGWTTTAQGPFSYAMLANIGLQEMQRSASGFKESIGWRVRARPYKFQTTFAWSDWRHLVVVQ